MDKGRRNIALVCEEPSMLMDIVDNAGSEKDLQEEPWRWTGVSCVEGIIILALMVDLVRPLLAALDNLVCESVCVCDCDLVDCRTLEAPRPSSHTYGWRGVADLTIDSAGDFTDRLWKSIQRDFSTILFGGLGLGLGFWL